MFHLAKVSVSANKLLQTVAERRECSKINTSDFSQGDSAIVLTVMLLGQEGLQNADVRAKRVQDCTYLFSLSLLFFSPLNSISGIENIAKHLLKFSLEVPQQFK